MNDKSSMASQTISDLVDGCFSDEGEGQMLEVLLSDPQSAQTWHAYHVIGDVMRSAELAPCGRDLAFLERFAQKLAQEPQRPGIVVESGAAIKPVADSANAAVYRWKMLAGLACTALLGLVVLGPWTQVGLQGGGHQSGMLAAMPAPGGNVVTANTNAGPMIRDAQLDELMMAHRQLGGHSALQVPAGFLRNATYEGPAR